MQITIQSLTRGVLNGGRVFNGHLGEFVYLIDFVDGDLVNDVLEAVPEFAD